MQTIYRRNIVTPRRLWGPREAARGAAFGQNVRRLSFAALRGVYLTRIAESRRCQFCKTAEISLRTLRTASLLLAGRARCGPERSAKTVSFGPHTAHGAGSCSLCSIFSGCGPYRHAVPTAVRSVPPPGLACDSPANPRWPLANMYRQRVEKAPSISKRIRRIDYCEGDSSGGNEQDCC